MKEMLLEMEKLHSIQDSFNLNKKYRRGDPTGIDGGSGRGKRSGWSWISTLRYIKNEIAANAFQLYTQQCSNSSEKIGVWNHIISTKRLLSCLLTLLIRND